MSPPIRPKVFLARMSAISKNGMSIVNPYFHKWITQIIKRTAGTAFNHLAHLLLLTALISLMPNARSRTKESTTLNTVTNFM